MAGRNFPGALLWCSLLALTLALAGCSGTADRSTADPGAAPENAPAGSATSETAAPVTNDSAANTTNDVQPVGVQDGDRASQFAEEISRGDSQRKSEAQFYLKQGNKWFNLADYERAEEMFKRALALDPDLQEARTKLTDSMMLLGKRDGEIRSVVEQFGDEIKVGKEQRLAEARRYVDSAQTALDEGDVDKAVRNAGRARELLLWFDYGTEDISGIQAQAQSLYDTAVQRAREMRDAQARERYSEALAESERLRQEAEERRRNRVDELLRRVVDGMIAKEYRSVIEICDQVIELEPGNRSAPRYRRRAQEMQAAMRKIQFLEDDAEQRRLAIEGLQESSIPADRLTQFPRDEAYWKLVVMKREQALETTNLDDSFEIAEIKRTLATQPANFDFEDQPLIEVVNFLRDISGLNITIDPDIDSEEKRVDLKLQNVVLQEALDLILRNTGLDYTFKENTLYITEKGKAFGDLVFDIYNVTDILNKIRDFPGPTIQVKSSDETDDGASPFDFGSEEDEDNVPIDPDELAELIKESTGGEDLWGESNSEINPHKGQILVTATVELHRAVKSFLENLRKDSDLFVIVETRFIDMVDDFLEDIGVDVRNLGQPPGSGFGTAYGNLNSARTGGTDIGFSNLGNPTNPSLLMGQDRVAGRIQHILDGFIGAAAGTRLTSALRGLTLQVTWLDPYQINAILRATQETRVARTVTAPRITASNGQRVNVSVITQRSYIQDYELVSGGTGLVVQEVADPVVATFQDGVILDVQPVISSDRKYVTLDVRPTLAALVNGVISTVTISLGSLTAAATLVDIDLPEITLQQAYTSVTVPDGGTVLLGGFRALNERKLESYVPFVGKIPFVKNAFRRQAYLSEKRSVYILLTAKIIDLRADEKRLFN